MEGSTPAEVYILITFGSLVMIFLTGFLIVFFIKYQQKVSEQRIRLKQLEIEYQQLIIEASLESQEIERRRVASDLHDSVGAMLAAIRLGIGTIARAGTSNTEAISDTKILLDETIESVRKISRDLMPSTLELLGLGEAIHEMCDRFEATTGIAFKLQIQLTNGELGKKEQLIFYRVVQEIINNALKHAKASSISVSLIDTATEIEAIVKDNGKGFFHNFERQEKDSIKSMGLGLFTISGRINLLGGKIRMDPEISSGTTYYLTIPYEKV